MAGSVETERLRLERWDRREHAPGLAAVNADAEVMRFITGGATHDAGGVAGAVRPDRRALAHLRLRALGRDRAGERADDRVRRPLPSALAARAGSARSRSGGGSRRDAWGSGYATEAGRAGLAYGFERIGLAEIVSLIHPDNERSLAVAGRLGHGAAPSASRTRSARTTSPSTSPARPTPGSSPQLFGLRPSNSGLDAAAAVSSRRTSWRPAGGSGCRCSGSSSWRP